MPEDTTSSSQQQDRSGEVEQRPEPFVKFPLWLIRRNASSVYEKAVLLALMSHGGSVFPSHRLLAEEAGCGLTKLKETLIELRKKGWITWEERFDTKGQISNIYKLHLGNLEWHPPSRDTATPLAATRRPPSRDTTTPQSPHGDEIDSLNKNQLTRVGNAPASPDAPTPRDKRRNRAQEIQGWVESIPSEFAEYREEIQSWLEARWDQSSRTNFRDNPWGPKKNSLKALKLLAEHCPDKTRAWIEDAAQGGYTSLGYSGFREKIQRLANVGSNQPPQRRRQHLPDLAEELRRKGQL